MFREGFPRRATRLRCGMLIMAEGFFTLSARNSSRGPVQIVELDLRQQIDGTEFDRMNQELGEVVRAQPRAAWVLDLTHVQYTGSVVLGVIVNIRQQVKQTGGRLVLCGMSQRLMEIFRTCSLDRLFTVAATRESAVKMLS